MASASQTKSGNARTKPHEEFAEKITAMLAEGVAPWQKAWKAGEYHAPFNPVSGTIYRGVNRLMLSALGLADPRWMTFKQAQEKGWRVKSGSKARQIEFWQWTEEVDKVDEDGRIVYGPDGQPEKETVQLDRPRTYYFSVFNASQLETEDREPIPPYKAPPLEWNPHEKAEAILDKSGASIFHDQSDKAFYSPTRDEIHLPYRENFAHAGDYYNTALHELGHWACSKRRLGFEGGLFGSELYAKEELMVEIASWMICQDLGLDFQPESSAAYVGHWIQFIKDDPYEIVRACRDAERIKKYMLDLELGLKNDEPFVFTDSNEAANIPADQSASPEPQTAAEAIYLKVPYREKNQAKALGAKWDAKAKLWMAPAGTDLNKLRQWMPEREPAPAQAVTPEAEFADVLRGLGFKLEGLPLMDGHIHRAAVEGGKAGARDGAYCAHADGVPNGWAKNHKSGELIKWICSGHSLSDEQRAALLAEVGKRREERERKLAESRQKAADRYLDKLFSNTVKDASDDHPYLKAKGVRVYGGLKEDEQGNLLLAGLGLEKCNFLGIAKPWLVEKRPKSPDELMATRYLQTLQTISPDGQKRFEPGSQKTGAAFIIGDSHLKRMAFDQWEAKRKPQPLLDLGKIPSEILVAEGYATGATLYKASGKPVAVAFDAGNLKAVALALKKHFPGADITICADNDHSLKTNVGVEKAHDAAQAVGGRVLIPEFTEEEKARSLTDFNDLAQSRGLFTVTKILTTRPGLGLANAADEQSAAPSLSL